MSVLSDLEPLIVAAVVGVVSALITAAWVQRAGWGRFVRAELIVNVKASGGLPGPSYQGIVESSYGKLLILSHARSLRLAGDGKTVAEVPCDGRVIVPHEMIEGVQQPSRSHVVAVERAG